MKVKGVLEREVRMIGQSFIVSHNNSLEFGDGIVGLKLTFDGWDVVKAVVLQSELRSDDLDRDRLGLARLLSCL